LCYRQIFGEEKARINSMVSRRGAGDYERGVRGVLRESSKQVRGCGWLYKALGRSNTFANYGLEIG
jgi:hypothetical protein